MTRLRSREHWLFIVGTVSVGHFLSHFYILAYPPLFPMWKAQFGLTNTELGLIMSASLVASLFQVPVGNFVDRVGAKWVFVTGLLFTSGGVFLVGLADSYLHIIAFTVVSGLGQVAFHPSDYAMIDSVTDRDTKGKGFSIHTFSGYVGFAVAPVVVGTIAVLTSWQLSMFVAGSVGLLYAVFAALALKPAYREELSEHAPEPDAEDPSGSSLSQFSVLLKPPLLLIFLFFIVFTTAIKGIQTFTTVGLADSFAYTESTGNTSLTVYFANSAAGILFGGVLADRYRAEWIIVVNLVVAGTILLVGVLFLFPLGVLVTVGTFAAVGFFAGIVYPSRDQLISRFAQEGSAGTSFGFVYTGTTFGGLLSPPILGWFIDRTAPWFVFVAVAAAIATGAVIIFLLTTGRMSPSVAPAPTDD